jgi:hypothetical protein
VLKALITVAVVVAALTLLVTVYLVAALRYLRPARDRVRASWAGVEKAVSAQAAVARSFGEFVRSYIGTGPCLDHLSAALAIVRDASDADQEQAERALVEAIREVDDEAIQWPELQGDPAFRELHRRLDTASERVEVASVDYGRERQLLHRLLEVGALLPAAVLLRILPAPAFNPASKQITR